MTLDKCRLFAQLSAKDLEKLRKVGAEKVFKPGGDIFTEGSEGDTLYVLLEGVVDICVTVDGKRQVLSSVSAGDFFGEMAVLEGKGRSASAVAKTRSVVFGIPRDAVIELVNRSPEVAFLFLKEISHRLREFNTQYLREVLQAERLAVVGRFARSIVHDLKNPLNIIGLTAEIAQMPDAPVETREEAVKTIRSQVDRITEMVGDILEFTQPSSPGLVLPTIDYADFINAMVPGLKSEAALRNVSVELPSPAPSAIITIHEKRLRRVFYNLTQNATDAMAEGGRVIIRFELKAEEVVTEVEDTGPGLAPEILGSLFQAFATYGKANGTGLGLSICKRILEEHHGWIAARQEPGRGAMFQFGLPLIKPAA